MFRNFPTVQKLFCKTSDSSLGLQTDGRISGKGIHIGEYEGNDAVNPVCVEMVHVGVVVGVGRVGVKLL